ncbi:hypothetical protein HDU96_007419, partial [Phlyctochytrium bullatum]
MPHTPSVGLFPAERPGCPVLAAQLALPTHDPMPPTAPALPRSFPFPTPQQICRCLADGQFGAAVAAPKSTPLASPSAATPAVLAVKHTEDPLSQG